MNCRNNKPPWLNSVAVALDQLVNAICRGFSDETISSRAHRRRLAGKPLLANLIDALFFWDKDHCKESYENERLRKQLPPELR